MSESPSLWKFLRRRLPRLDRNTYGEAWALYSWPFVFYWREWTGENKWRLYIRTERLSINASWEWWNENEIAEAERAANRKHFPEMVSE